jgi:TorA maturation chaperone TorD
MLPRIFVDSIVSMVLPYLSCAAQGSRAFFSAVLLAPSPNYLQGVHTATKRPFWRNLHLFKGCDKND